MKTLSEIAGVLRERAKALSITQTQLGLAAGISRRTTTHVLSGNIDYKLTTLFAVLDRLGLELAIVPKGAASPADAGTTHTQVKTRIDLARERAGVKLNRS